MDLKGFGWICVVKAPLPGSTANVLYLGFTSPDFKYTLEASKQKATNLKCLLKSLQEVAVSG